MEAQEFIDLLETPERAKEKGIDELKKLAQAHPYSQPAQLLYAIRLRKSSEHLFHQQLGRASILTNDRSVLFDLFEQDSDDFDLMPTQVEEEHFDDPQEKTRWQTSFSPTTEEADGAVEENEPTLPEEDETPLAPMKVYNAKEQESEEETESAQEEASEAQEESAHSTEEEEEAAPAARKEKDLSSLPADERVRAILERNRMLREDFERKKQKGDSPLSDMDERLKKIKERLSALKRKPEEEAAEVDSESLEVKGEKSVTEETEAVQEPLITTPELSIAHTAEEEDVAEESVEAVEEVLHKTDTDSSAETPTYSEPSAEAAPHFTADADEEVEEAAEATTTAPDEVTVEEESVASEEDEESFAPDFDLTNDKAAAKAEEDEAEQAPLAPMQFEVQEEESEETEVEEETEEAERTAFVLPTKEEVPAASATAVDPNAHMSFSEWLKHLNQNGSSSVEGVASVKQSGSLAVDSFENKVQLLDSFVEKLPSLKKKVAPGPKIVPIEIGNLVNQGNDSLVTETLAKVYIAQKHYDKAIKAYQILKLKYPEKSSFFATQISEIKKLRDFK